MPKKLAKRKPPSPPEAALWFNRDLPLKLGCTLCPDLAICGGLRIKAGIFDCRSLCACARGGKRCFGVCRKDPVAFIRRVNEVNGFAFDDIPRCAPLRAPALPGYAAVLYAGSDR